MDQAHLTKRLSFIRYLYQLGAEQSRAAAPKAYAALFTFHDSIELFLVVAGEHCRSSAKTSDSFWRYWESIDGKLQPDKSLTNKREIDRLVRARNSFKHAFILPSLEQIEEYRTTTRIFFESNTFNIFERDFHHLTMADLVQNETVKTKLKKAEEHIANHEYKEALIETDHAFKLTTISIYRDLRIDHRRIEPRFDYDVRGISGEALRMIGEAFARSLADLKTDLLREIIVIGYGVSYTADPMF